MEKWRYISTFVHVALILVVSDMGLVGHRTVETHITSAV
jgi:hypothetical protein